MGLGAVEAAEVGGGQEQEEDGGEDGEAAVGGVARRCHVAEASGPGARIRPTRRGGARERRRAFAVAASGRT
nr:hypothetical protein GCM10025732_24450 [Glycomyces mayteni]